MVQYASYDVLYIWTTSAFWGREVGKVQIPRRKGVKQATGLTPSPLSSNPINAPLAMLPVTKTFYYT